MPVQEKDRGHELIKEIERVIEQAKEVMEETNLMTTMLEHMIRKLKDTLSQLRTSS